MIFHGMSPCECRFRLLGHASAAGLIPPQPKKTSWPLAEAWQVRWGLGKIEINAPFRGQSLWPQWEAGPPAKQKWEVEVGEQLEGTENEET